MIHINSEDYTAGTRYDGTWQLSRPIVGNYKVLYQTIELGDIPWISSATENIHFKLEGGFYNITFALFPGADLATYQFSDDLNAIATYIRNRVNSEFTAYSAPIQMTSITVDTANERFVLQFNSNNVHIVWTNSTCATIFEGSGETAASSTQYMSTKNITLSCHLFMKIDESVGYVVSTGSDIDATLIFHTSDIALLGQTVSIRQSVSELNIQLYRASFPEHPVPITLPWELVLVPI